MATVTPQRAHCKATLVEHIVQLVAKELAMKDDRLLQTIFLDQWKEARSILRTLHLRRCHPTDYMQNDAPFVAQAPMAQGIFAHAGYQTVESMPEVHLGHSNQMQHVGILCRNMTMEGNCIEIYAIADTDSTTTEDLLSIGKSDHRIHLAIEPATEQLIDMQSHQPWKIVGTDKLLIVGIGRHLGHCTHTHAAQTAEQPNEPGAGILETAGIDKFYLLASTITNHTSIAETLAKSRPSTSAIILKYLTVNKTTPMAARIEIVITQMHLMAVLLKPLHLRTDFLGDSAAFRESMIDEEKNLHRKMMDEGKGMKDEGTCDVER